MTERLLVGVEDRRHHEAVLAGDSNTHVDPLVKLEAPVAERSVCLGVIAKRQRCRLDDQIVV